MNPPTDDVFCVWWYRDGLTVPPELVSHHLHPIVAFDAWKAAGAMRGWEQVGLAAYHHGHPAVWVRAPFGGESW